jgi:hypothetical protein
VIVANLHEDGRLEDCEHPGCAVEHPVLESIDVQLDEIHPFQLVLL